jgi:hypothetical protein
MSSVSDIKKILDETIDQLKKQSRELETHDLLLRLESVQSSFIRNEKKIWLRTKIGRKILTDLSEIINNLLEAIVKNDKNMIICTLSVVEACVKNIEEESRKRNMVVT